MPIEFLGIYGIGTAAVMLAGIIGIAVGLKKQRRAHITLSYIMLALPVVLLVGQLLKLYANKNYADFTISHQVIAGIVRGTGPWSAINDSFMLGFGNWLSAHFTPIIYLFCVPYALFQAAETLLVSQFLILLLALPAIYVYARRWLGSHDHGIVIAAVMALYPAYQYIHLYELEMLRFSIPLLLLAFYALEVGKLGMYWVLLSLCLLVREEVSLTTCLLGIYTAVCMKERRWVGILTAALSVGYFLVVMEVIMPALRSAGSGEYEYVVAFQFAALGRSIGEVAVGIVTKPQVVLQLVADPLKLANLFMYGLPLLFIPLLAWPVLLVALGNVGPNLLSASSTHTSYFLYYLSPAIAVIFVALVKGVRVLGAKLDAMKARYGWKGDGLSAVLAGAFAAAFVANVFFGPSPLSLQFWFKEYRLAPFRTLNFHYTQYVVTEHDRRLTDVVAVVPKDVVVSAEQHILPALYDRKGLKVFPDISGVDYVVLDKRRKEKTGIATVPGSWDGLRQNPQFYYDWVERDPDHWALVTSQDGYFVYKRRDSAQRG